ncbi:hypothetical protein DFS33DRAFT_1275384 [Desarmillaria ectypa]|nr:hypothetical protein DFS33DRAFT_1275384 [Desarmillaria ectypa]
MSRNAPDYDHGNICGDEASVERDLNSTLDCIKKPISSSFRPESMTTKNIGQVKKQERVGGGFTRAQRQYRAMTDGCRIRKEAGRLTIWKLPNMHWLYTLNFNEAWRVHIIVDATGCSSCVRLHLDSSRKKLAIIDHVGFGTPLPGIPHSYACLKIIHNDVIPLIPRLVAKRRELVEQSLELEIISSLAHYKGPITGLIQRQLLIIIGSKHWAVFC